VSFRTSGCENHAASSHACRSRRGRLIEPFVFFVAVVAILAFNLWGV
jgi:hypothetical protein